MKQKKETKSTDGFPKTIFLLQTVNGFQAYLKDEIPAGKDEVGKKVAIYKMRKGSVGTITIKSVAVIDSVENKKG